MVAGTVTDADIYATVAAAAPIATILWTQIGNVGGASQPLTTISGILSALQGAQTIAAAAFTGSIIGTLSETQGAQTLQGVAIAGYVAGTLAETQGAQTLIGAALASAVWNPSDVNGMTVSAGDLTATTSVSTQAGVRTTQGLLTGKVYAEVGLTTAGTSERVGLANKSWSETTPLGSDTNSIGIDANGAVWIGGTQVGTFSGWTVGALLCIATDFGAGLTWFRVSSGSGQTGWGNIPSSVSGSQTSGTAQPVITAPASATVPSGASVDITGIVFTDTNWPNSGNCTLNVGCNTGTIAMTVSGSQVAGSGTSYISDPDVTANVQAAATSLVYTAPGPLGPTRFCQPVGSGRQQFDRHHRGNDRRRA